MKTTTNTGAAVTVARCNLTCSCCKGRIAKGAACATVEAWTVHSECAAPFVRVRAAQDAAYKATVAAQVTGEAAAEIEAYARRMGDAS